MVTTHRRLTALLPKPVKAVVLDTPYGFQENAPELASRAVEYFATSVNVDIKVAGLTRLIDGHVSVDPVEVERGLNTLTDAGYIFAGPGSPTYALRQWAGSRVPTIVADKLRNGGIVTFASAAALTLGRSTVPVYEVYKVGADVTLLDGLDLLGVIGIDAAVIPHYDNAEGGHHDTRFCYLGEKRLQAFEQLLADTTYVLGVDEHTGLVIDIDAGTATVVGNGTVTVRLRGTSRVFRSGAEVSLAYLQDPWSDGDTSVPANPSVAAEEAIPAEATSAGLDVDTERCRADFDAAMEARDAAGAVRATLDLEASIRSWSADTLQSDAREKATAALRSMITRLGDAATSGVRDPRDVVGPFVEAMLQMRAVVRAEKRYDLSDLIRDSFVALGVEVRDTPNGVEWHL
jgi:hypothetical protein